MTPILNQSAWLALASVLPSGRGGYVSLSEPHGLREGQGCPPKGNYYQKKRGLDVGQPKTTDLSIIAIQ